MKVSAALVEAILVAEAAILVLTTGLLSMATAFRQRLADRRRQVREVWLAGVRPRLDGDGSSAAAPAATLSGGRTARDLRRQIATVSHLTESLTGDAAGQVVEAAGPEQMVAAARTWCRSRFWWRRLRGVRTLANLGMAGVAGVDLTAMLDDENLEVRAAAAISIPSVKVTQRAVERLVALLDGEPRERWSAADALSRIGEPAVDPLLRHLGRGPRRPGVALRVAAVLGSGRLLPAVLAGCRDSRPSVRAAAAAAVAAIGGEDAAACLVRLLQDDAPAVREAAARGLGILEHWPATGALARLLHDPVWEVRRAAGLSLRVLGPAGRLHLRRAAADPDARVAEIARHVSDLPASAIEALR